jgi:hypothetical protein
MDGPAALPTGNWVVDRAGLDTNIKIKIPLPNQDPNSGRPERSQSLWLSYPGRCYVKFSDRLMMFAQISGYHTSFFPRISPAWTQISTRAGLFLIYWNVRVFDYLLFRKGSPYFNCTYLSNKYRITTLHYRSPSPRILTREFLSHPSEYSVKLRQYS